MRIIGGTLGKRHINTPAGLPVRPTTDKAKEALFNILNHHVDFEDISVLDLFAGTGSISFEFASRRALKVTAVEKNIRCIRFIQKIKQDFSMQNLHVVRADALSFIDNTPEQYDVVFCDPPYNMPELPEIPERIFLNNLTKPSTVVIVEHPANIIFDNHPRFSYKKNYSKVHFSFFMPR